MYEALGFPGLVYPGVFPKEGDCFHEGRIGYHLRKGTHYLSRWDWQKIMEYRRLHQV